MFPAAVGVRFGRDCRLPGATFRRFGRFEIDLFRQLCVRTCLNETPWVLAPG